jgi:murein DD-endopeptidase MepM/ murein hydrolase activator NlpD
MPGSPGETVILAPEKNFITNKLIIWWQQLIGQPFGVNGEKGIDFNMPFNSAVGAFEGGQVVYAGLPVDSTVPGQTSLGYVVQVRNVDGSIIHYQHLNSIPSNINVGSYIGQGQVIGYSGGCATGSSVGNCIQDYWSTGPHIETRYSPTYNQNGGIWGQQWQDPKPYFTKLGASFKPGTVGQNTIGTAYGPTGTPSDQFTSGNCAPWDIACLLQNLQGVGIKIGIFAVALVLVIFGGILLIHPDVEQGAGTIAKAALL